MPFSITIVLAGQSIEAELNDSDTALRIVDALPIEAEFNTWGDEIYFTIPVKAGLEDGREIVEIGDLGYWPPGNALAIFFGPTPISKGPDPEPASDVNLVGKILGDATMLKEAKGAHTIRIEKDE